MVTMQFRQVMLNRVMEQVPVREMYCKRFASILRCGPSQDSLHQPSLTSFGMLDASMSSTQHL